MEFMMMIKISDYSSQDKTDTVKIPILIPLRAIMINSPWVGKVGPVGDHLKVQGYYHSSISKR